MNRSRQILAFADDVDIIARNKKVLIEMYNKLDTEGKKLGLVVNKEKTKYMKMDRMKSQATAALTINDELQFNPLYHRVADLQHTQNVVVISTVNFKRRFC